MSNLFVVAAALVGLLAMAPPAGAQWTRVGALPASDVFTVWANGDTIVAGSLGTVFVSVTPLLSGSNASNPSIVLMPCRENLHRLFACFDHFRFQSAMTALPFFF